MERCKKKKSGTRKVRPTYLFTNFPLISLICYLQITITDQEIDTITTTKSLLNGLGFVWLISMAKHWSPRRIVPWLARWYHWQAVKVFGLGRRDVHMRDENLGSFTVSCYSFSIQMDVWLGHVRGSVDCMRNLWSLFFPSLFRSLPVRSFVVNDFKRPVNSVVERVMK